MPQPALLTPIPERQPQFQPLAPGRIWVVANMDPLCAANELGDVASRPSQRFGDLHTTGAAADDTPALAVIRHIVVPARRVEGRAGEILASRDVRKQRLVQKAGGSDEDVGDVGLAVRGLNVPAAAAETRGDDLLVEANEFGEATVAGDFLHIGPDLGRRRIFARSTIVRLKRKLVLPREDIDEQVREGIVPPGASDFARLFIDREIDAGASASRP